LKHLSRYSEDHNYQQISNANFYHFHWFDCHVIVLQVVFVTFIAYAMLPIRTFVAALFSISLAAAHLTLTAIWADDWLTWQQVSFFCSLLCSLVRVFCSVLRPPARMHSLFPNCESEKRSPNPLALGRAHNEAQNIKLNPLFAACLGFGSLSMCVCKQATASEPNESEC
jgi:hypothetical protein